MEQRMADIVAEVLGIDRVGRDDNFFLMGGHSLLGAQVVLRMRDAFAVDVTLWHLFEAQTVGHLAVTIEQLLVDKVATMTDEEAQHAARELTLRRTSLERNVRSSARAPGGGGAQSLSALDPAVLANPYPLYVRCGSEDRCYWDPFLHTWVVTRYADVLTVCTISRPTGRRRRSSCRRWASASMAPIAQVMVKQMLFMDAPAHTRLRRLCSAAFTPRRVESAASAHPGHRRSSCSIGCMTRVAWMSSPISPRRCRRSSLRSCSACRATDHAQLKEMVGRFRGDAGQFPAQPRPHSARAAQPSRT